MALGALLLGSMRRSDMLSTRVCFCREWVRYIVGDVDCVDTALAKMDKMGTKLREARRWARQRKEATSERPDRNLGLGGMPYVQPKRVSSRQTAATTGHQDSDGTGLNTIGGGKKQHLGEGHSRQRAVTVGQQVSERYSPEQLPPEPISVHDPSTDLYSPEQYYSTQSSPAPQHCLPSASLSPAPPPQSNQPIRRQCQPEVQSETWEERNILLDASIVSTASRKDSNNLTPRHRPTSTTSLKTISPDTIKTPSPNPPSSSYSECVTNPFLDGSSSSFSPPSHDTAGLPPDLPFRLFNWRRAESDSSPPKEAVPFPIYPASPKRSTADRSKDGLSPVPTLARLGGDRGVGALWRRRIEKMTVSEGGNK